MKLERTYVHHDHGPIGSVVIEVKDNKFVVNGKVVPDSSQVHLMRYASQSLQDSYAGAKSAEDAVAAFETRMTRLVDGTIGEKGTALTPLEKKMNSIARQVIKAELKRKGRPAKDFTDLDKDKQADVIEKLINANRKEIEGKAKEALKIEESVKGLDVSVKF